MFSTALSQKDLLPTLNTIYLRPPSRYRETEMSFFLQAAVNVELGVFTRPPETYRSRLSPVLPAKLTCLAFIIITATDHTPIKLLANTGHRGWSSQPCYCHRIAMNDTPSPSCSHPADHTRRLLCPDVWQLHAAHVLLRLIARLHLGELDIRVRYTVCTITEFS